MLFKELNVHSRELFEQLDFTICDVVTSHCLSYMGASTVKGETLDPCSCLSESDPKLYTHF